MLLLALIASRRRASDPFRPLLILVPLIGAGGLGWRIWVHTHYPDAHKTHLFPTHLRVDSLFRGVLLAYVYHSSIAPGSASCDGGGPSR